jgi:hypothetical protein
MGSEMQPGVMRAQKREIQISHVKKSVKKFTFSMELEVFFTIIQQTYSKLVISFMNRKSSCGYATHFLTNVMKMRKNSRETLTL